MTAAAKRCGFKGCSKPEAWGGYCHGHQAQLRRGATPDTLTPLRARGGGGVVLPGLTVSASCAAALEAKGPSVYQAARAVLEAWAKRQ